MKILCISDQIDPAIYNNAVKEIFGDVDMVLCAGDLPMEYIDFVVSSLNVPTFFIFGNHNLKEFRYYEKDSNLSSNHISESEKMIHFHGAKYVSGKVLRYKNILIAGTSGSLDYNHGKCQYTESQMCWKLIKMIPSLLYNKLRYGRYLDIFLTHATPRKIHDHEDPCHKGFKCYLWFLRKFAPRYMIHGHIHLYDLSEPRISKWENTTIINAYGHHILDYKES